MKKLTAEETLKYVAEKLNYSLAELQGVEEEDFIVGERTAYVECLEWLQRWERAAENGLGYDIEKRFPL